MSNRQNRITTYRIVKTTVAVGVVLSCLSIAGCGHSDSSKAEADPVIEVITSLPEQTESPVPEPASEPAPDPTPEPEPDPAESFYAEEISDEIFARMEGKSFPEECTTSREDLRYLHLLYRDIEGRAHEGEMVCNAAISSKLIDIFRKLYEAGYPIERMVLIDDYDADDMASMSDNNTSCFNFRVVSGTAKLSKHALGMAVDINPRYNPYVYTRDGETHIEPDNGADYTDRSADFDYKIDTDDLAYKLFTEAGFTWGGAWKNTKDYQHFQISE
ncbi:MAG: M15 family metallopeptidase [Lachnospiraceae bacterium]|nr:M15 family metallopeptidase [Lachnospiraceae bacterium]